MIMNSEPAGILLLDDDEVDTMNIMRTFRKINIPNKLYTAEDGVTGLALLRGECDPKPASRPKVVLLDINMPRMDGIEFLRELRKDPDLKDTIVFILTTSNNEREKAAAYNLNIAGYIVKPLDTDVFIDKIRILHNYLNIIEMP